MLFINILFVIIFSYGLELFELHGKNSNQTIDIPKELVNGDILVKIQIESQHFIKSIKNFAVGLSEQTIFEEIQSFKDLFENENLIIDKDSILIGKQQHLIEVYNLTQENLQIYLFQFGVIMYNVSLKVQITKLTYCRANCSYSGYCTEQNEKHICICNEDRDGSYCQFQIHHLYYFNPLILQLSIYEWAQIQIININTYYKLKIDLQIISNSSYNYSFDNTNLQIQKYLEDIKYFPLYDRPLKQQLIQNYSNKLIIGNIGNTNISIQLKLISEESKNQYNKPPLFYIFLPIIILFSFSLGVYLKCYRQIKLSTNNSKQDLNQSEKPIPARLDQSFLKIFLPKQSYNKIIQIQPHLAHLKICIICQNTFQNNLDYDCSLIPCGHLFHFYCIKNWLTIHNFCPSCKINFKEEDFQQRDNILVEALQNPSDANNYIISPRQSVLLPLGVTNSTFKKTQNNANPIFYKKIEKQMI